MEANKEQLISNIIADFDYIKQLLNENILHAATTFASICIVSEI